MKTAIDIAPQGAYTEGSAWESAMRSPSPCLTLCIIKRNVDGEPDSRLDGRKLRAFRRTMG